MTSVRVLVLLLLVGLIVVVGVLVARALARRNARPAARRDPLADIQDVDYTALAVGAVVGYAGTDSVVRGTLRFNQEGYTWAEHLLDDVRTKRWLAVEDDEGLELVMWTSVPLADVTTGAPGDREIVVDGVVYRLDERGTARFTAEGTTGTSPAGTADYADYVAADGRVAGFERYGAGPWEAGVGQRVSPGELTIYAAPRD